jgi:hypothetical protein
LRRVGCDSIVDANCDFNGSGQNFGLGHHAMSTGFSVICRAQDGGIVFANQFRRDGFQAWRQEFAMDRGIGKA